MPTLQPILSCSEWQGPPVISCMLSLAWRTVINIRNLMPSAENFLPWYTGTEWRGRMDIHSIQV